MRKITIAVSATTKQLEVSTSGDAILKLNEFLGHLCDKDPSFDTAYDYGNLKITYKGKVYEIKPTNQKFPTDN
jgi:hypothetical protein